MGSKCPKCQATQQIDFTQFDEGSVFLCRNCQTPLSLKVVLEIADNQEEGVLSSGNPPLPLSKKRENQKTVVVCIDGEATRSVVKDILEEADFHVLDIPSGISAFMSMKLEAPELALIDAGFTDMPGTELISQIKGNPGLQETLTILVSTMYEKNTKYRQAPPALFGADDHIDRIQIQTLLLLKTEALLQNQGQKIKEPLGQAETEGDAPTAEELLTGGDDSLNTEISADNSKGSEQALPDVEASKPSYFDDDTSGDDSSKIQGEVPTEEESDAVAEAKRLARIIVSDIALYNEEKVEEGIQKGTFYQILENDIKEGARLYQSRVDESLYHLGLFEQEIKAFIEKKGNPDQKAETSIDPPEAAQTLEDQKDESSQVLKNENPEPEPDTETEIAADEGPIFVKSEEALKQATQIARDIISNIIDSNEDKIQKNFEVDHLYEVLGDEIMVGRQLFEEKAPAYFDSSLYEEEIDRILEERSGKESPVVDETLSNPSSEGLVAQDIDRTNEDPEIPEPEDSVDAFTPLKQEAVGLSEESPSPPPESAWEDSIIPETQDPKDVFKQMEQDAANVAEGSPSQIQDNAWKDSLPPAVESSNDVFDDKDQVVDPAVTGDVPQTTDSAWNDSFAAPISDDPNDVFKQMEEEAAALAEAQSSELEDASPSTEGVVSDDAFGNVENISEIPPQEASEPQLEEEASLPELGSTDDIFGKMESPEGAPEQSSDSPQLEEELAQDAALPQTETGSDLETSEAEDSDEMKDAKRIAKIILSDIVIYNEKKVEEGIKKNTFHLILQEEIKEGLDHFESRVSEDIFNSRVFENVIEDFIQSKKGTEALSEPHLENIPDVLEGYAEAFPEEAMPETPPQEENTFGMDATSEPENGNAHTETASAPVSPENGTGNSTGNSTALVAETKEEKDALRLAKIIVSDIVIYNEDKVEKGIQFGNFHEILEDEIKEGELLYESRVSKEILEEKNYLKEAIEDFIHKKIAASS